MHKYLNFVLSKLLRNSNEILHSDKDLQVFFARHAPRI